MKQSEKDIFDALYNFVVCHMQLNEKSKNEHQMKETLKNAYHEYELSPEVIKIAILCCEAKRISSARYLQALINDLHENKTYNESDATKKFFFLAAQKEFDRQREEQLKKQATEKI